VGNSEDGGGEGAAVGELFGSAKEGAVVAAREALAVALTSVFILRRDIPAHERTSHVSKHLARIDRHLERLAKLIGVTTGPPRRAGHRHR
jgi:acyl-CoA reductase-like NAD-dependent aldehyde dehydrogenase